MRKGNQLIRLFIIGDPLSLLLLFPKTKKRKKGHLFGSTMFVRLNTFRTNHWAFAEFTDTYEIETDFAKRIEEEFVKMICAQTGLNKK